ncbi:MAG: multiheme c-type cytochrome [Planctomycetota bacterium]|nr:multiheme c-type cytochrome [Planctomycetota bacterium]
MIIHSRPIVLLSGLLLSAMVGCGDSSETNPLSVPSSPAITPNVVPIAHRTRDMVRGKNESPRQSPWPASPDIHREEGYVGSKACKECHEGEFTSWHSSYHSSMTQIADRTTVIPEIENIDLEYQQRQGKLEWQDDALWATVTNPDGDTSRHRIVMTTGSHHAQAFWHETGNSNVIQMFPFAYRIAEQRWIPVQTAFLLPPRVEESFSFAPGVWNHSCSQCHATSTKPVVSSPTNMETAVADFGIACESCHGPGSEHIDRMQNNSKVDGLAIVHPDTLDPKRSSEVCGQCHAAISLNSEEQTAQWLQHGWEYRPGDDLQQTKHINQPVSGDKTTFIDAGTFWDDGVVRVSGREFNGLLKSPCYDHDGQHGKIMTCTSCHEMHPDTNNPTELASWSHHQLKPQMRGNAACTQCHEEYLDQNVLASHTHHAPDSSGSDCMNCHMPYTTYGLLKASRNHAIEVPSVTTTFEVGRPNGCNMCHLDKSLGWTADYLKQWYGIESPELPEDEKEICFTILAALKGNAVQRALAAWALGWPEAQKASSTDWAIPFLGFLLQDNYHAVRFIADRSLGRLKGDEQTQYDSLAEKKERDQSARRIVQKWLQDKANRPTVGATFLMNDQGQPLIGEINRLLKQRDLQEIVIGE